MFRRTVPRPRPARNLVASVAVAATVLAACAGSSDTSDPSGDTTGDAAADSVVDSVVDSVADSAVEGEADSGDRLTIVTTVAPITSIAANVIGDRADIVGVVPEGTNSHTFEPSPSVAAVMTSADAVFINGLQLEEPTKELAEANLADGVPLVELGDETIDPEQYQYDFSFPESEGKPNPHLWTDPTLVKRYAEIIRDTMVEVDPDGQSEYDANFDAFSTLVDEFDTAVSQALETVPEDNRKLVTYHDAYAYFADTYGWTVVGAIQPADFGEPTPSEVVALIGQIEDEGVPAIFGSEVFPSPVLEQVANETGAEYIDDLRDDDLPGAPGEVDHSWLGLMKFNFVTMTDALGGDSSELAGFEVLNVAPDTAEYPQ